MNTDKPGAPYYQRSVEETLASVQSSPEGISGTEAATRLQQYVENALPQKPGKPAWLRFIAHFNDVLIYVLLAAALLKAVMGHWIDMSVILAVPVVPVDPQTQAVERESAPAAEEQAQASPFAALAGLKSKQ